MSRALAAALLLSLGVAAAPVQAPSCDGYRVARGDTLYRIARRCHSSIAAIARASGIRNPNLIRVGQRLRMPGQRATATAVATSSPARAASVYRMARGDTLYSLARWSGTRLPALLAANPGVDPHKIEIGDAIRLPAGAVAPERARARERGPSTAVAPPPPRPRARPPRPQEPAPAREPEPRPERARDAEVDAM